MIQRSKYWKDIKVTYLYETSSRDSKYVRQILTELHEQYQIWNYSVRPFPVTDSARQKGKEKSVSM